MGATVFGTWQQSGFYAVNSVNAIRHWTPAIAAPPTNGLTYGQNYLKFRIKLDFSQYAAEENVARTHGARVALRHDNFDDGHSIFPFPFKHQVRRALLRQPLCRPDVRRDGTLFVWHAHVHT